MPRQKRKAPVIANITYKDLADIVRSNTQEEIDTIDWASTFKAMPKNAGDTRSQSRNRLLGIIVRRYTGPDSPAHHILTQLKSEARGTRYLQSFLGDVKWQDDFGHVLDARNQLTPVKRSAIDKARQMVLQHTCMPLMEMNFGWEGWAKIPSASSLPHAARVALIEGTGHQPLINQVHAFVSVRTFEDSSNLGNMLVFVMMRQARIKKSDAAHIHYLRHDPAGKTLKAVISTSEALQTTLTKWMHTDQGQQKLTMHDDKCEVMLHNYASLAPHIQLAAWTAWLLIIGGLIWVIFYGSCL